eukprot:CAMPEP_0114523126 /NCGR_PEP_ID=MMETSP0109-20121206/21120_1 /TAXON_ID=29199 /ORGANISM="Chlorarachnion reptans, Strain CCCM449" /LENGTH=140 /DNA_ID=CAMNT_0001704411 /DNA_START=681 /DNA_END=1100 /DNA_ORIENTATION=-
MELWEDEHFGICKIPIFLLDEFLYSREVLFVVLRLIISNPPSSPSDSLRMGLVQGRISVAYDYLPDVLGPLAVHPDALHRVVQQLGAWVGLHGRRGHDHRHLILQDGKLLGGHPQLGLQVISERAAFAPGLPHEACGEPH